MSQTSVTLTDEQRAVIQDTITNNNGIFAIAAAAGSG